MRYSARWFLLALVTALATSLVSSALAWVDPASSTVPCGITLVGLDSHGNPDPAGTFTITIRAATFEPIAGAQVTLDFTACPDVSICSAQVSTGFLVQCSPTSRTIHAVTDPNGQVTFSIVGGGTGHQPCSSLACMKIYAYNGGPMLPGLITDGILHPVVTVSATDEDGAGGISAADLSRLISDALNGSYCARSDFDHAAACVSSVGAPDISRWLTSFFKGYVYGCGSLSGQLCP
jgi:hypothetical protein